MSTTVKTLILAAAALLAVRYVLSRAVKHVVTTVTTDYAAKCLAVLGQTTRVEDGNTFIVGSFKNDCDRKFSHVTVAFALDRSSTAAKPLFTPYGREAPPERPQAALDLPQAPIFAYSRDVAPGETREFKSAYSIPENAVFRFESISGF
jgi:hypothetical protein